MQNVCKKCKSAVCICNRNAGDVFKFMNNEDFKGRTLEELFRAMEDDKRRMQRPEKVLINVAFIADEMISRAMEPMETGGRSDINEERLWEKKHKPKTLGAGGYTCNCCCCHKPEYYSCASAQQDMPYDPRYLQVPQSNEEAFQQDVLKSEPQTTSRQAYNSFLPKMQQFGGFDKFKTLSDPREFGRQVTGENDRNYWKFGDR